MLTHRQRICVWRIFSRPGNSDQEIPDGPRPHARIYIYFNGATIIRSRCRRQSGDVAAGRFTESGNQTGGFTPTEEYRDVVKDGEHRYTLQTRAAPNPTKGPQEPFIYSNSAGTFKIPDVTSVNGGLAKYMWKGEAEKDRLTYIAHGYVTETQGAYLIPNGTKVSVWAYRGEDAEGDHWFLYFGTDDIIHAPQGKRYPMYYSYGAPGPNTPTYRFLTQSGTTRQ